MEFPGQVSSAFLPFPGTCISSNLAPLDVENVVRNGVQDIPKANDRKHLRSSINSSTPPSKKRHVAFPCEACGTQYTEKRALARHRHTTQHRRTVGLPPTEKYGCTLCKKTFSRDHDRVRHEREGHRGHKRSARQDFQTPKSLRWDETMPEWQQTPRAPLQMECVQEQDFIIADDVRSIGNGWDTLSTTIEVYPGPANWIHPNPFREIHDGMNEQRQRRVLEPCPHQRPSEDSARVSGTCTATTAGGSSVDKNSQSWFAEDSDSEGEAEDAPGTQLKLKSTSSTTADSAVDMSETVCDGHEPKRPSITTFDYRVHQPGEKIVVSSENDIEKELDSFSSMTLGPRPHVTVMQRRGKTSTIPASNPLLCVFCDKAFEEDDRNLLVHLRQHMDMFRGDRAHICVTCKISFVHKADLEKHTVSADIVGHCGFAFDHRHPCTGHHRPDRAHSNVELSDADRFRLSVLGNWEHSQLRTYMAEIEELVARRNARSSGYYSIEALVRRSRSSFSSFAVSVNTYGSAPCDATQQGRMDVGGLKHRLRMMSLKGSTSGMRETAKRFPHFIRSGSLNRSLYKAATSGDLQQIDELVKLGGQPSAVVGEHSILSAASQWADAETARLLIGLGADVKAQCGVYGSALASAAHEGKLEMVDLLLDAGAEAGQLGGKYGSALGAAVASGHVEVAQLLLDRDADANAGECALGCPLSIAAIRGCVTMVQLLSEHGADLNQEGGDESSPIGFAVWHGRYDVVRQLADNGANLNAGGGKHGSPLCAAIVKIAKREGQVDMVKLLLELGADVNMQGSSGSPLRTAASHADVAAMSEVVALLITHGADVNSKSSRGNALQLAKMRRQHWMDRKPFLLQDVDDGVDDIIGFCYEVIRLLKEAGASDEERRSASLQWLKEGGASQEGRRPTSVT